MKTKTLTLTEAEFEILRNALSEAAMQSEDNGNEGNPVAEVLWKASQQLKA